MKKNLSLFVALLFFMSFMIVALPGAASAGYSSGSGTASYTSGSGTASYNSGSGAGSSSSLRYRTIKLKLTSSSKVTWAKLYVDGVYKGQVRKSSYKRIRLRAGKSYQIVAKKTMGRRYFERKKNLFVSSRSSSDQICFLHVSQKSGSSDDESAVSSRRTVKFKLTSSTKPAWGKLYVNGRYKGRVTRSRYKYLKLEVGKTYRIKVKRTYAGRRYTRNKTLRVKRGSRSQICFLHLSARR